MTKRGDRVEVTSHWSAGAHPELASMLAVHLLDLDRRIISQADHTLYRGERIWVDQFYLTQQQVDESAELGIAVYDPPNAPLAIQGGNCDWNNHRLVLSLGGK